LLNYKECFHCKDRSQLKATSPHTDDQSNEDHDDSNGITTVESEEIIEFTHVCNGCGHVVAAHYYSFLVTKKVRPGEEENEIHQEYMMDCVLCGKGRDLSGVLNHLTTKNPEDEKSPAACGATPPLPNGFTGAFSLSGMNVNPSVAIIAAERGEGKKSNGDNDDGWED